MCTVSECDMAMKMQNCLCSTEFSTKSWDLTYIGIVVEMEYYRVQIGAA